MGTETLTLVEPTIALELSFCSLVEGYRAAGEERYQDIPELAGAGFEAYVRRLEEESQGVGLPPGYVPQTTFWLVRAGTTIVGISRLRHHLTPALEQERGHIGYDTCPSERHRGYGTRLPALTLEKARAKALQRVLVTCDTDNVASARVIQKYGGQLAGEVISARSGKPVSRYWIHLLSGE